MSKWLLGPWYLCQHQRYGENVQCTTFKYWYFLWRRGGKICIILTHPQYFWLFIRNKCLNDWYYLPGAIIKWYVLINWFQLFVCLFVCFVNVFTLNLLGFDYLGWGYEYGMCLWFFVGCWARFRGKARARVVWSRLFFAYVTISYIHANIDAT